MFSGAVLAQGVTNSQLFRDLGRKFGGTGPAGRTNVGGLITQVIEILLLVSGGLAVVFLIIGGIQYVLSRGNEEAATAAKKTMTAAVFGLVIIIMAYAIVFIVAETLIKGSGGLGI